MELLPIEIFWMVAEYLTCKEIAACCAVSRGWRNVFSHDSVWKTRCDPTLEEYLRTTPCVVEPAFVSPELKDSTLSPVGHWRLAFMRENHMWNNWQLGKQHFTIIVDSGDVEEGFSRFYPYGFLGNDHAIVINKDGCINVWNLLTLNRRRSALKTLPNVLYKSVSNNMGIFVKFSGVQVIVLDHSNDIRYKTMFFFDEDNKIVNNDVCSFKKVYDIKYGQEFDYSHSKLLFVVVGTVFIGSPPKESSSLHIWDLETGSKLKEEECPLMGNYSIINIVHSRLTEFVAVVFASKETHNCFTYLIYDPQHLSFLPFRQTMHSFYDSCAINKHYIAFLEGCWQSILHIYNFHSSEHIFECQVELTSIGVFEDCFVFSADGTITSFNLRSRNRNIISGLRYVCEWGQKFLKLNDTTYNNIIWKIKRSDSFRHICMKDESSKFSSRNLLNHSFTRLLQCFNGDVLYLNTFW